MKELWPGWEIVEAIGTGGFSKVYKIRKNDMADTGDYYAALKVITIPQSQDEYETYVMDGYDENTITSIFSSQVKKLVEEFRLMAQFKGNSNIVSYEDHMIIPHADEKGWDILIRMELLSSLPKYCTKAPLSIDETVKLGIDICRALELCQKKNIIHRDIKPQNIFVNEFGDYKLGDFGIARSMDHTTHATKTGTYSYMAPEVYRGEAYGITIDMYSLGLVLYWLLNERRMPFLPLPPEAPSATQLSESQARRLAGEPLPAPKNGSERLKQIVLKACAFHAADRYPSATEMRRALEAEAAALLLGAAETATAAAATDRVTETAAESESTVMIASEDEGTVMIAPEDEGTVMIAPEDEGTVMIAPEDEGTVMIAPEDEGTVMITPEDEGTVMIAADASSDSAHTDESVAESDAESTADTDKTAAESDAEATTDTASDSSATRQTEATADVPKTTGKRLLPLIGSIVGAVVLIIVILLLLRGCKPSDPPPATSSGSVSSESVSSGSVSSESASSDSVSSAVGTLQSIQLDQTALLLKLSDAPVQLKAAFTPSDLNNLVLTWESSDKNVAEVSADGTVTAKGVGQAVITARCGTITATCNVEVAAATTLNAITVVTAPTKTEYTIGEAIDLSGLVLEAVYSDGSKQTVTEGYTCSAQTADAAGTLPLTISYQGATAQLSVTVKQAAIAAIKVLTPPTYTTYFMGDKLVSDGLTLEATYENGKTETITDGFTCTPTVFDKAGTQKVTVSYGGKTTSFSVTVQTMSVSSVTLLTPPEKTTYYKGDTLNTKGLSLKVVMNNGKTETVTSGFVCSPSKLDTVGTQKVTVSYGGKTTSFSVTVQAISVSSVTLLTPPEKNTYYKGDALNTKGLSLKVVMNNGKTETVTSGFVCSPSKLDAVGTQKVTVSYGGKTTSFSVTIKARTVTLTFNANDGSGTTTSKTLEVGAAYGTLPTPTRDYYTFNGWYTAASGGTKVTTATTMGSANVTLYAQWTQKPLSDWVLASAVPSGAKVESTKWTYTKTETTESTAATLSGWSQTGSYWKQIGSGSTRYASFPAGFSRDPSVNLVEKYPGLADDYSKYATAAYKAYDNGTTKRVVTNTELGYIYWHWMYDCGKSSGVSNRAIYNKKGTGPTGYAYKFFYAFNNSKSNNNNYSSSTGYCNNLGITNYIVTDRMTQFQYCGGASRWFRFKYYSSAYVDYQKMYQYKKVTNGESTTEVTAGGTISNVQKYVRYRAK